jgi:ribosomal protein S18 acetylase RimI-like enzyme
MIRVRPARVEDAAALCAAEQVIARTPGLLISRPEELRPEAFAALIEKLTDGVGCYFVAEENGFRVGHAFLNPMELIALSHVFRLTIVVHPGQNGRGIGSALMRAVCDWATRSPTVHKVELLVRSTNEPALSLYKKFGFVEEGRLRERVGLPDGSFVDEISMAWFPRRPD